MRGIKQFVSAIALAVVSSSAALATTVVYQPYDGIQNGWVAQNATDLGMFATQFDDFSTSQAWNIGIMTAWGVEQGNPGLNVSVVGEIWNGLPGSGSVVMTGTGTEIGNDLSIDFNGQTLPAGNYWATAYVVRPWGGGGGQWFWNATTPVNGSEHWFFDSTNYFGYGVLTPGSQALHVGAALDMAFQIDASPVPEPATAGLVCLSSLWLLRRKRHA